MQTDTATPLLLKHTSIPLLHTPCAGSAQAVLLLAHGAGAGMESGFMTAMASALAADFEVVRFEFPYMHWRRQEGVKAPPDRMPKLCDFFSQLVEPVTGHFGLPLVLAGKSMGGRVASLLAASPDTRALAAVAFGFPFHPPAKPERLRTDHLGELVLPLLICQGTRDPFGKPDEVAGYTLGERARVHWLEGGNHDFEPLKRSGQTQLDLVRAAAVATDRFVGTLL